MNVASDAEDEPEEIPASEPLATRGFGYGLLGGLAAAVAYALSAELLGLTWGLVAVGLLGGLIIGGAVTRGAWNRRKHITVRRLQIHAAGIAVGAWVIGVLLAYLVSQALFPQATTALIERLSPGGFTNYFSGLDDTIRVAHAASLAGMAFMAWREAR